MLSSFRASMAWLHTWFGLLLGFVLMAVFFFGSLSVFDREIDRWVDPRSRFEPQPMPSYDAVLAPLFAKLTPAPEELAAARSRTPKPLGAALPVKSYGAYTTHRDPLLSLYAEFAVRGNPDDPDDHVHGHVTIDPRSGRVFPQDELRIGSEFFYPLHLGLQLEWRNLGYYVVGFAAFVMLVALVSGVVVHRRLFREFFTFRPQKNRQRSTLDLHNLTGVLALPFHFVFPLTGLIIFASLHFPVEGALFRALARSHQQAQTSAKGLAAAPAGVPAELTSVDAMVRVAEQRWRDRGMPGQVGYLTVTHVGDANSYVSIYRAGSDRVTLVGQGVHFSGTTGQVLYEEPPPSAVAGVKDFLVGLHLQHFEHWLLRWLYAMGGLLGTTCIATGLVFFVNKRRRRHASTGVSGARWVDALAVTSITGMVVATLAILVASRVLPEGLEHRGDWEKRCFWLTWLLTLVHAGWRSAPVQRAALSPAWREQCWAIAGLALAAVLLNWFTTGDHLLRTLARPYWPVAALDTVLLATAAIATLSARRLATAERRPAPDAPPPLDDELPRTEPEAAAG